MIFKNLKLLSILEWDQISKKLEEHSHFDNTISKRILKEISYTDLQKTLTKTNFFLENFYEDSLGQVRESISQLSPKESITEILKKIEKNGVAQLSELNQCAILLEFHYSNFQTIKSIGGFEFEDFNKVKNQLTKSFLKEFRSFYDKDGSYDFLRHPKLRSLYKKQLDIEASIRRTISNVLSQLSQKVQFSSYDIINDRYVIPIKTNSYTSNIGQIISRSDTGQTLYIEPTALKEINFKRLETIIELENEIHSLEKNYSDSINQYIKYFQRLERVAFYFDEYLTRSSFAHINNYVLPNVINDLSMDIEDMYHPLIERPVKNSVELLEGKSLIISGPNTGGKTASIKTIAIISLLANLGLAVPAKKAKICFYQQIFYFGDDLQNLVEGVSSFAGEVIAYNDMLSKLKTTNLILIDEIFNSTSSEEASALALSFFEAIKESSQSQIIVSTHHQMLKTLVQSNDNFLSSHVGFDTLTRKPTYKLYFGIPGASQALDIYKELSQDKQITEQIYKSALKHLDNKHINYEKLLSEVAKREEELSQSLKLNKKIGQELKNQKAAMESVLKLKEKEYLKSLEQKTKTILNKAYNLVKKVKKGDLSTQRAFEKEESLIKADIKKIVPEEKSDTDLYSHLKKPSHVEVGKRYFSLFLKNTVLVKKIDLKKKVALVQKGTMTISCPIESLRMAHGKEQKVLIKDSIQSTGKDLNLEYDCRGMRLEEFSSLVESSLPDLLSGQLPYICFIHGHGTGVLKNWLRNFIKKDSKFSVLPNNNGNDGETRIILVD